MSKKQYYSVEEVAKRLNIDEDKLKEYIKRDYIKDVDIGSLYMQISQEEFWGYLRYQINQNPPQVQNWFSIIFISFFGGAYFSFVVLFLDEVFYNLFQFTTSAHNGFIGRDNPFRLTALAAYLAFCVPLLVKRFRRGFKIFNFVTIPLYNPDRSNNEVILMIIEAFFATVIAVFGYIAITIVIFLVYWFSQNTF